MNLSGRLAAIEKKAGTQTARILFIVPDGTQHKMIDDGRAMTTSQAAHYQEELTAKHMKGPCFVALDPRYLDV